MEITLRMFDRRVIRGMFGVKKEEVADRWKKIHNWRLHNLYCPYDDEESEEIKEDEKFR
jgi:hypothetical protein